ncbi:MAG TPA: GNAT family protein [Terracidiphilus sp.]|jgi:ribosomal-protein-alanine N-acetyltransferase|nr:GNAT family protein [Terracidiphilus sp.]
MKGPRTIKTERLLLRRPTMHDAQAILDRYAGDPVVTRYMSWPTHRSIAETSAFVMWSEADWELWPAGSYLVFSNQADGILLGGTGLSFRTPLLAVTGYVLAQDAWGRGYATEALRAMVDLAEQLGVRRLEAECHVEHQASGHVMEKCGFTTEGVRPAHTEFPNLAPHVKCDVLTYARRFEA